MNFKPIEPGLLTDVEAAVYLLLVESDQDVEAGRRKMNRLVDQGKVRPCLTGGKRRYAKRELDRFIDDETNRYGQVPA